MTDDPGAGRSVHIAAICGSMRRDASCTRMALEIAAEEIESAGASFDLIDLGLLNLPLREGPRDNSDNTDTLQLRERAARADGILLGSPEYHTSFSGVLKNALDLLSGDELRGKLFGLLGVGGGEAGAINTLGHLRHVVRGVGGWSLPAQVSIANSGKMIEGGRIHDGKLEERIRSFARELVRFTRLYSLHPHLEERLQRVIDSSGPESK